MPKKNASVTEQPVGPGWAWQVALVLVIVALVLGGIVLAGRWGLEQLRGRARYLVDFSDIECPAPPGLSHADFLDEVRYEAQAPARLGLLDDNLAAQLTKAFAQHPWVETVDGVTLERPRTIRVHLTFRRPVLAVRVGQELIAVDRNGVRLPRSAPTAGLPVYPHAAAAPAGNAGTPWGDPKVHAYAARLQ